MKNQIARLKSASKNTRHTLQAALLMLASVSLMASAASYATTPNAGTDDARTDSAMTDHAAMMTDLKFRQQNELSYVCGGVGKDEMDRLKQARRESSLLVLFAQGKRGEYIADADVSILRGQDEVAHFKANGAGCLLRLPNGRYTLSAQYKDIERKAQISISAKNPGREIVLRWPQLETETTPKISAQEKQGSN